jgi:adenylosuccinate lyase
MIPRYARPVMSALWQDTARYSIWLEIETLALEALAQLGVAPESAAVNYREKGRFEVERIDAIEREVRHDVIAFLTNVAEHVGDDARFAHQGMTSSDVLDTCLAVQLTRAADLLIGGVERVMAALKLRAMEHKFTACIGRSHGVHAEPTTFGLKLASHYAEFDRCLTRMRAARAEIATCAISGAVGTFANVDPFVEAYVAEKLGLAVETISSQVIPRDRHAMFFATLGVVACAVERLATEIRHLQRFWKRRSSLSQVRRAHLPCRTSEIRSLRKTFVGWHVWSGRR